MEKAISLPITRSQTLTVNSSQFLCEKDYEFLCISDGTLLVTKRGIVSCYTPGDILLIPPMEENILTGDAQASVLLLGLQSEFIRDNLNGHGILFCDSSVAPHKDYMPLKRLILSIYGKYQDVSNPDVLSLMGLLYLLLSELKIFQPESLSDADISERYQDRVRAIEAYIDLHCNEPISLPQIASAFYLTPQYFSAFMKTAFHQNFKPYLTQRRLFYAGRDLRSTDLSVMEIALKNGFGSISVFRNNFTNFYKMSPLEYRKYYCQKAQSLTAVHPHPLLTDKVDFIKEAATSALHGETLQKKVLQQKIGADVSAGDIQLKNISSAINIGAAQNLLSDLFRKQLLELNNDMHFTHLRIQEMISNSFIPMVLPNYNYYFQKVDTSLSFLFEHNLAPWIELAKMPLTHEYSNGDSSFYYIRRDKRYLNLLTCFLSHVAGHWPHSWTKKWRFEIWMSPRDTTSEYMQDFHTIQNLISSYLPGAGIGGPGFNSYTSACSLDEILQAFHTEAIRPDFFSIYLNYHITADGTGKDTPDQISSDPAYIEKTAALTANALQKLLPGTPLVVSEWTSADISNLPVANSRYQAAFIARTLLHITPYCDAAAYWLLSDVPHTSGILNPPEFYYFGQSLFNREGLPTASYFAYKMFHRLSGTIITQGENYCVTRNNRTHYQVLAFNYVHFAPSGEIPNQEALAFDQVYGLFQDVPDHQIIVTLHNLEPGVYLISRVLINLKHGSILDIIIGEFNHSNLDHIEFLQKTKSPSQNELLYRSSSCIPEERRVFLKSDETLTLETEFAAHDVCLWDIRKQV